MGYLNHEEHDALLYYVETYIQQMKAPVEAGFDPKWKVAVIAAMALSDRVAVMRKAVMRKTEHERLEILMKLASPSQKTALLAALDRESRQAVLSTIPPEGLEELIKSDASTVWDLAAVFVVVSVENQSLMLSDMSVYGRESRVMVAECLC